MHLLGGHVSHAFWNVLNSGFDLAWFSSLFSKHLCVFGLHGAIYIYIVIFCLHHSYLLES